jgi:DNA polymerase I-like protein with 3'-5' exonuclease and polymerase domains
LHGEYLAHGTVTGRLASKSPNLQNNPSHDDGLIKGCFLSRWEGGFLIEFDYSQIELRVAACWFRDKGMMQAYMDGADLHTLTAIAISGLTAEAYKELPDAEKKAWRSRAKRVNFGSLYGGGSPALMRTLAKDGIKVTKAEAQGFLDAFFAAREGLRKGIHRLEAAVTKTGYIDTQVGRRRRLPSAMSDDRQEVSRALRQAVNFPIQSIAGDMTELSLILLAERLEAAGMLSIPILTVHDSIIVDCVPEEVEEVLRVGHEIMEGIRTQSLEILPAVDWSWLSVPILADAKIGRTWGKMVDVPKDPEGGLMPWLETAV